MGEIDVKAGIGVGVFMHGEQAEKAGLAIDKDKAKAIQWLADKTGLDFYKIANAYKLVSNYSKLDTWLAYRPIVRRDKDGKRRVCYKPNDPLLYLVQKKFNRRIFSQFPKHINNIGFSGGKIEQAIIPHLGSETLLSMDIKNAFHNTRKAEVIESLKKCSLMEIPYNERISGTIELLRKGIEIPGVDVKDFAVYSRLPQGVPEIIAQICTFPVRPNSSLVIPQGVSSSPKLFDEVMRPVDEQLSEFMERVKGKYTRYADNIFCSGDSFTLRTVKEDIKNIVGCAGRRNSYKGYYKLHKIKFRDLSKPEYTAKMLGLNIIDGRIVNTPKTKKKFRAVMFYLRRTLKQENDPTHLLNVLNGLKGSIRFDTLTPSIKREYEELLKILEK